MSFLNKAWNRLQVSQVKKTSIFTWMLITTLKVLTFFFLFLFWSDNERWTKKYFTKVQKAQNEVETSNKS